MGCKSFFCKYNANVTVNLNNKVSAITYKGAFVVLVLCISCMIIKNASWNKMERGVSSVYVNVEGVDSLMDGSVNDAIDLVRPSQEKDAFFIATNIMVTEQKQNNCTDHDQDGENNCKKKEDCLVGRKFKHGINTGECDVSKNMCRIRGWCPVENMNSPTTITSRLSNVDDFTVYVRNNVEFFSLKTFSYNNNFTKIPTPCIYDAVKSPMCPIFSIKNILREVDISYASVREKGAVIGFFIKWECYFNLNPIPCTIKYSFERFSENKIGRSAGYKYKYTDYHIVNGDKVRTKTTARGLRFLFIVGSKGYKFNEMTLLQSIGSFLGYFSALAFISLPIFKCCCFTEEQKRSHALKEEKTVDIPLVAKA